MTKRTMMPLCLMREMATFGFHSIVTTVVEAKATPVNANTRDEVSTVPNQEEITES